MGIIKRLFVAGNWHVAYRRLPVGSILSDRKTPFIVIENGFRFHAMDPFVFEHGGETYIFVEAYDRLRSRGTIGYSKWNGKAFSGWKQVIVEPYHMSYPFIFEDNGGIYMVPESFLNHDVHLYRAVEFPDKWENVGVLAKDVKYVDTTIWNHDGRHYAFTYDIGSERKRLLLFEVKDNKLEQSSCRELSSDDRVARPGGKFFSLDGKDIRVSQDCEEDYGKAVVFSHVHDALPESYSETQLDHIGPGDVVLDRKLSYSGIHTYNATSQFEVIDLKGKCFSVVDLVGRLFSHFHKKRLMESKS